MTESISTKSLEKNNTFIFVVSSTLITAFLFFIDEGNYNFAWAKNIFSWIVFLVYAVPIFLCQVLVAEVIAKRITGFNKYLISIFLGAFVGIALVIGLIF